MIETDFEDFGGGGVARDVAAEFAVRLIRAHDHRERVPAIDRGDAFFDFDVARKRFLTSRRYRVAVGRERPHARYDAELLRLLHEPPEQEAAAPFARVRHDGSHGIEPLARLLAIGFDVVRARNSEPSKPRVVRYIHRNDAFVARLTANRPCYDGGCRRNRR